MDVARSTPQGAHYHADVIYLLPKLGVRKGARALWSSELCVAFVFEAVGWALRALAPLLGQRLRPYGVELSKRFCLFFSSLDYPSSQYSVVFGSTLSTKLGGLGRGRGLAYGDVSI